ncbi:MAG: transposase [Actinomycetia bacterium]|nr:transposase [Actinomycetes bacterium]
MGWGLGMGWGSGWPRGARVSELDRLRRGPVRVSGPQMKWSLERAEEIADLGMGELDVSGIPPRRLAELSRYGVDGKAALLKRHSDSRRLATLLATGVHLTTRAVDDPQGWLGEVAAIEASLAAAEQKLTAMRQLAAKHTPPSTSACPTSGPTPADPAEVPERGPATEKTRPPPMQSQDSSQSQCVKSSAKSMQPEDFKIISDKTRSARSAWSSMPLCSSTPATWMLRWPGCGRMASTSA